MNRIVMNVSGIANAQMKTSLKNALGKIEGVQAIDVDKTLGRVEVEYNQPAGDRQIRDCVEESGFTLI